MKTFLSLALLSVCGNFTTLAQQRTVGLFLNDTTLAFRGYTLFAPITYGTTYLINNDGLSIKSWTSNYNPGLAAYFLESGNLLRACRLQGQSFAGGGAGGRIEMHNWDGSLVWQYEYANAQHLQHHDMKMLPNGNVVMIAWEAKTSAQAIAAGRNPTLTPANGLWPDHLIEVNPGGTIVWEWHVWDHLVQDFDAAKPNYGAVANHPELIKLNYVQGTPVRDWNHINAIDYNTRFDQLLVSVHNNFSEIWVIDHSTTTAEAAGHTGGRYGRGGDLLYRWGNPRAYNRGATTDQKLFQQHDAQWIASGLPGAGNILIFNNGVGRPGGNSSSVDEIIPPADSLGRYALRSDSTFGPTSATWTYIAPTPGDFYSFNISGAQRQPNGTTLICSGEQGTFFEVTPQRQTVWNYINPVVSTGPVYQGDMILSGANTVFKIRRYAPGYSGFSGRTLTPGGTIERYRTQAVDESETPQAFELHQNFPNPFNPTTNIGFKVQGSGLVSLKVFDVLGREVVTLVNEQLTPGSYAVRFDAGNAPSGIFFYRLHAGGFTATKRMILLR